MKIGIIGAMAVEVDTLKQHMTGVRTLKYASMEFFEGILNGEAAVVVRSGAGKVSAAICVQLLCDRFGITHIINTGVAGSLDERIDIGDIVISSAAVYHDVDAVLFGYAPGEVPMLGATDFPASEAMAEVVLEAAEEVSPDIGKFRGRICTGDQFIANNDRKTAIRETFGGLCTEMEGAGIAHAAYLNGIPYVIVRAISDKADGSDAEDYPVFEARAAKVCARITEAAVGRMGRLK